MKWRWIISAVGLALTGCASPEPVLYPNAHFTEVGQAVADRDIADCRAMAESHGAPAKGGAASDVAGSTAIGGGAGAAVGAVGGAVLGSAGSGAAFGAATGATAGLLRGLFKSRKPSAVHLKFVDKCLRNRGYAPIGWK